MQNTTRVPDEPEIQVKHALTTRYGRVILRLVNRTKATVGIDISEDNPIVIGNSRIIPQCQIDLIDGKWTVTTVHGERVRLYSRVYNLTEPMRKKLGRELDGIVVPFLEGLSEEYLASVERQVKLKHYASAELGLWSLQRSHTQFRADAQAAYDELRALETELNLTPGPIPEGLTTPVDGLPRIVIEFVYDHHAMQAYREAEAALNPKAAGGPVEALDCEDMLKQIVGFVLSQDGMQDLYWFSGLAFVNGYHYLPAKPEHNRWPYR